MSSILSVRRFTLRARPWISDSARRRSFVSCRFGLIIIGGIGDPAAEGGQWKISLPGAYWKQEGVGQRTVLLGLSARRNFS